MATLVLGAFWTVAWAFTVDDAFIAARYAVRLAHGAGYTFAEGPATDGVTGPLWLVPLTLAAMFGVDPVSFAKGLGGACSACALWWVIARVRGRALGRAGAWVSAGIGVSALPFVAWATAGLETGFATLAATMLALAVTARPRPCALRAGCAACALALLRPEMVPLGAALLIGLTHRAPRAGTRALAALSCALVVLVSFRLAMFGDALPLSAHAKPPDLGLGLAYLGALLARPRAAGIAILLGVAARARRRDVRLLLGALLVHVVAVVLAGGDWMPGFRLFAPTVPLLALTLGLALPAVALRARRTLTLVTVAALLAGFAEVALTLPALREAGMRRDARLAPIVRAVCTAPGPVALVDVGALGFACPQQSLIDLGGLTEPAIARADGGHLSKHVDSAWLHARAPALLVLHSRERPRVDESGRLRWFAGHPVERRVLTLSWVSERYRVQKIYEYAPNYYYVLLAPQERSGGPLSSVGS